MKAFFVRILGKKKIVIALLIVILAISTRIAYIRISNLILKPAGSEVSMEEFREDIRKIAFNEKLNCAIFIEDPDISATWGISENFIKANDGDRVLVVDFSRFLFKKAPIEEKKGEIKSLVRTFFYMKSHSLPIDIIGIKMVYTWILAGEVRLYMTIEELEELYRQVYVEGLPLKEQVDLLADIIVEKSGYERNGHEFWINKLEK